MLLAEEYAPDLTKIKDYLVKTPLGYMLRGDVSGAIDKLGSDAKLRVDAMRDPETGLNAGLDFLTGGVGMTKKIKDIPQYLQHTKTKPDKTGQVGSRFEREFMGGLLDKKILMPEDFYQKPIIMLPYDNSSRNMAIHGTSGHRFENPYITHAGDDYGFVIDHANEGIIGASNKGVVDKLAKRVGIASEESVLKGGSPDVVLATQRMGERTPFTKANDPKDFSEQPTELFLRILDNAEKNKLNISSKNIAEIDDMVRNTSVPRKRKIDGKEVTVMTKPFTDFKGVMTAEGREQLRKSGPLRKGLMQQASSSKLQNMLKFNIQDIDNALADAHSLGTNIGDIGNAFYIVKGGKLKQAPSSNNSYDTNFFGEPMGTLGTQFSSLLGPFKPKLDRLNQLHGHKQSNKNNMFIGSINRADNNFAQYMGEEDVARFDQFLKSLKRK